MSVTNDGGPIAAGMETPAGPMFARGGLTIRDWFAGMALQGSVSCADAAVFTADGITFPEMAEDCYRMADAMLAVRDGKESK